MRWLGRTHRYYAIKHCQIGFVSAKRVVGLLRGSRLPEADDARMRAATRDERMGLEEGVDGQFFAAQYLPVHPLGVAQDPEKDGVMIGEEFAQARFHGGQLRFGQVALEYGVLHARQVAAHELADFADALFPDIIDNDDIHDELLRGGLPPGAEGAVGLDAGQVADQLVAFQPNQVTIRDRAAQAAVLDGGRQTLF